MANTKQGEVALIKRRADTYKKIAMVIEQLPDRFFPTQLYKLAGIKDAMANRWIVALVLEQDFKFRIVGSGDKRQWTKI